MEAKLDKVEEINYLELVEVAFVPEDEDNDPFVQWIRTIHLDDGNLDPQVASHAKEFGIDADKVMMEEVYFSSGTSDSFQLAMSSPKRYKNTLQDIYGNNDGNGESEYDDDDDDDDGGGGGGGGSRYGDGAQDDNYSMQLSLFTCEENFTHATQDEDHGCRATSPGIRTIRK